MNDQQDRRYDLTALDELTPYERTQIKRLLPQIEEMLENHRRQKWLLKMAGAFLLALPAVAAIWQAGLRVIDWIRNQ